MRVWKDIEKFTESFNHRTTALLSLLTEQDSFNTVLDIGGGMQYAKGYLENRFGEENIEYWDLDYVDRKLEGKTIVCDLNKYEFPKEEFDLFIVAGLLEYVEDVEWFFGQFVFCKKMAVISYCAIEEIGDINVREHMAWKNNLSAQTIVDSMKKIGFQLEKKDMFNNTTLLKFVRI